MSHHASVGTRRAPTQSALQADLAKTPVRKSDAEPTVAALDEDMAGDSTPAALQAKELRSAARPENIRAQAAHGLRGASQQLPHLHAIQHAFGKHDVSHVQAHVGGPAAAAAQAMEARAYATGDKVAFASTPDLHTAAHEAAHIVQQQAGVQLRSGVGQPGDAYETHADQVADRVVRGESAEPVLDRMAGPSQQGAADASVQMKEKKSVSSKAIGRLGPAQDAIDHTKQVFEFGAGNQAEALAATNFNTRYRLAAQRDDSLWSLTPEAQKVADQSPIALMAAKADVTKGGNCGEHAAVAYDYLNHNAAGQTISYSSVEGLDHAFVLVGDLGGDTDADIVTSDPWPTAPQATLWEDHFAFTADRGKINAQATKSADGGNPKALIAAGLTLSARGKRILTDSLSKEETEKEIKKSLGGWIWEHENAAAQGKKYEYNGPAEYTSWYEQLAAWFGW